MSARYVLLPDEGAPALLGPVPDGVEVEIWSGQGPPPSAAGEVGFWVPPFLSAGGLSDAVAALPALEVVQALSAGVDAFVGQMPSGVVLCDGRGVHGSSTAEWVLTAILASVREFPRFVLAQAEHRWDRRLTDDLADKRALVIGAGDVGEAIRRRLEPFEVDVTMAARRERPGVQPVSALPALLGEADIVVVVVPLTPATRHLIDAAFLARMHDGALLVNAARGPVADTDAITAELKSGRLRAALDVTAPEPLPPDHPLWSVPGLLLTPHVGGSVRAFPRRAYALVRAQVGRWAAGEPLLNVVSDGY